MGQCTSIADGLPYGTLCSPVLNVYHKGLDTTPIVIRACLFRNGSIYLVHKKDDSGKPIHRQRIQCITPIEGGVICLLANRKTATYKLASTGDILHVESRQLTIRDTMRPIRFPHTTHEEFTMLKVLFPDGDNKNTGAAMKHIAWPPPSSSNTWENPIQPGV